MMSSKTPYSEAMWSAYNELQLVKKKNATLRFAERDSLRRSTPLPARFSGDVPDMDALSLPNAIRLIISGADRPLSAQDMKTKLEDSGFDLRQIPQSHRQYPHRHEGAMASRVRSLSILTATKSESAGPERKPAPDVPGDWEGAMAGLAGLMPQDGITRRHLGTREKNQTNDFRNSIHAKGELLCRSDRHQSEEIGKGHSRLAGFECPLWGRSSIGAEQRTLNP